ncbi:ERF family protein [Chromobacterium piscinae]|uniref:ERF family protein n=1 Tax=Chromobacterium piscinae TaxID=686831 RepID=UPI0032078C53
MQVYQAIAAVAADMAAVGISKSSKNAQQGFHFRGIDAVYNALAPSLVKHKLCILPRCISREVAERTTAKGGVLFYVTVRAEFDLVSAEDGSKHTIATYGEAMDSGDKATNKAMSAAYKYAAFQAFCIPTEETAADADGQTHAGIQSANHEPSPAQKALEAAMIDSGVDIQKFITYAKTCGWKKDTLDGMADSEDWREWALEQLNKKAKAA